MTAIHEVEKIFNSGMDKKDIALNILKIAKEYNIHPTCLLEVYCIHYGIE